MPNMNKLIRRELSRKYRDWSTGDHGSTAQRQLKRWANRRIRHTAGNFSGGAYKALYPLKSILAYGVH